MEHVNINDESYSFVKDFKHEEGLRKSFNELTQKTFWFSLETWYKQGWWGDYYVPYSLLHDGKVISNVSINKMEFDIEQQRKVGIQIGTVMTDEQFRGRGLNRFIMEQVMKEWVDRVDFIYLFANDTVLDFYPKFDFVPIEEYQPWKKVESSYSSFSWKRLDMDDPTDVAFLIKMVEESVPLGKISMRKNPSLIMFYCNSYKKNNVYYSEELHAIAIAAFENDTLLLEDVFSPEPVEIDEIIKTLAHEEINQVTLGFTPLEEVNFENKLVTTGDKLFIWKDQHELFKDKQWMFPLLSHA